MTLLREALADATAIGFDTAPLIYFVERDPIRVDLMRAILQRVDSGAIEGYSSTLTLTEVLTLPMRAGNTALQLRYRTLLRASAHFHLVAIDPLVAESAADLRARYGLRTPDALQIATSMVMGCDIFISNDRAHRRVTEMRILILDDLTLE